MFISTIDCYITAVKPINVSVTKRVPASESMCKERIHQVLRGKSLISTQRSTAHNAGV